MMSRINRLGYWLPILLLAAGAGGRDQSGNGLRACEPEQLGLRSEQKKGKTHTIEPQLAQCTLEVGRHVLKPIQIITPWLQEHRAANRRVFVDKDTVTALRGSKAEPNWIAKSPDGHHLEWMTSDGTAAYFASYLVSHEGRFKGYSSPANVRRLDLETGHWLTSLPVGSGDQADRKTNRILSVLTGEGYVAVLTTRVDTAVDPSAIAYEVTCFRQGKVKRIWSRTFPSAGEWRKKVAWFGDYWTPDFASSSLQKLAWMGDTLLVCAGILQPVVCLNRDTGSKIWQLDRPWEFERSRIRSDHIGRFRLSERGDDPEKLAAARGAFNEVFDCAIIGGPIVVPLSFKRGGSDTHSIFLAVARGPVRPSNGYAWDCVLYEFNDRGQPVSMAKLPQLVCGGQFRVRKDGLVWRCQNRSFARVSAFRIPQHSGAGWGGPELLTHIPWFRQIAKAQPRAWLAADQYADSLAWSETHAFSLTSDAYLIRSDASVYQFPVSAIDLETGLDQTCFLHVPFQGKVPNPDKGSFSRSFRGEDAIHTYGAYLLHIADLRIDGSILEIALSMKDWSAVLHFDLSKVDSFRAAAALDCEIDSIKAWVRSLGDVNKRDEHGNTPLIDVSDDADARHVKALLEAGADVKAKTKDGWSALMSSACYGTAEVVQLLIDAGSDVNARDNNCGGQTVLMWAAGGLKEQKKKVQGLLKGGADPKATLTDGWNALMTAASGGHLPTVELLLEVGLDVNGRTKEGKTALMVGSQYGENDSLIAVLLKAGADVHARDSKGRTPLMYAAETGSLENIKVLLEAGADLHATDKEGKTALELARKSNFVGASARIKALEAASAARRTKK